MPLNYLTTAIARLLGGPWLRLHGPSTTTGLPMGAQVHVLSPNCHPHPSQGRQKGFRKGQIFQNFQVPLNDRNNHATSRSASRNNELAGSGASLGALPLPRGGGCSWLRGEGAFFDGRVGPAWHKRCTEKLQAVWGLQIWSVVAPADVVGEGGGGGAGRSLCHSAQVPR